MNGKSTLKFRWRLEMARTLPLWAILALAACASHRSKPPVCDGTYSPINASAGMSHDAQR